MKFGQIAIGLALCTGWLAPGCFTAGAQSVVFTSGPINGTLNSYSINQGFAVADSFTLAAPATLGSAAFGAWLDVGGTLTSVDWAIASSPFGSPLASGTALNPMSTFVTVNNTGDNFDIYSETFSLPHVSLGAGNYYFELQNAQLAEAGGPVFWDGNNSANSTGVQDSQGSFLANRPGESFTLFAPVAVPEPTTLALACLGPLVMLALRRKKQWWGESPSSRNREPHRGSDHSAQRLPHERGATLGQRPKTHHSNIPRMRDTRAPQKRARLIPAALSHGFLLSPGDSEWFV
jgi:hypothetical protein